MGSLLKDLGRAFASPAPAISWAILTGLLALTGPFGTYVHCTFAQRVACFGTLVALGIIWGVSLRVMIQRAVPAWSFWRASALSIWISAILLPAPVKAIAPVLTRMNPDALPTLGEIALLIVMSGYAAALVRWLARPSETVVASQAEQKPKPDMPRLLSRLDASLRGAVLRLSGRDHYVDVVTDRGQASILMRLSDAIAELDGVDGLQVHRSHWVAADAVTGADFSGERRQLVLSDGSRVPVSRNYVAAVTERGLLQRGIGTGRATGPVRTAMASGPRRAASASSELAKPPV